MIEFAMDYLLCIGLFALTLLTIFGIIVVVNAITDDINEIRDKIEGK